MLGDKDTGRGHSLEPRARFASTRVSPPPHHAWPLAWRRRSVSSSGSVLPSAACTDNSEVNQLRQTRSILENRLQLFGEKFLDLLLRLLNQLSQEPEHLSRLSWGRVQGKPTRDRGLHSLYRWLRKQPLRCRTRKKLALSTIFHRTQEWICIIAIWYLLLQGLKSIQAWVTSAASTKHALSLTHI